jgi:hypothetical protein
VWFGALADVGAVQGEQGIAAVRVFHGGAVLLFPWKSGCIGMHRYAGGVVGDVWFGHELWLLGC